MLQGIKQRAGKKETQVADNGHPQQSADETEHGKPPGGHLHHAEQSGQYDTKTIHEPVSEQQYRRALFHRLAHLGKFRLKLRPPVYCCLPAVLASQVQGPVYHLCTEENGQEDVVKVEVTQLRGLQGCQKSDFAFQHST